jgi:glutaredoxin
MSIQVTIYTRPGCSLCVKAKAAIEAAGVPDVVIEEVDIDDDADLRRRYTNDIPVILVNGREAFRHAVTPEVFAAYARGLR